MAWFLLTTLGEDRKKDKEKVLTLENTYANIVPVIAMDSPSQPL